MKKRAAASWKIKLFTLVMALMLCTGVFAVSLAEGTDPLKPADVTSEDGNITLHKQAELGKLYEKQLRDDVVRLCLALELGADEPTLRSIVEKAGAEDLLKLKAALENRLAECMPVVTQLGNTISTMDEMESGFMI